MNTTTVTLAEIIDHQLRFAERRYAEAQQRFTERVAQDAAYAISWDAEKLIRYQLEAAILRELANTAEDVQARKLTSRACDLVREGETGHTDDFSRAATAAKVKLGREMLRTYREHLDTETLLDRM